MNKAMTAALAALMLGATAVADARTLKVQASSSPGDWAHRFMTDAWQQKIEEMSEGKLKLEVLPTKAVVPHRETIDAVANGILDGDLNAVAYFAGRDPAFALMGDLIAGYDLPDQVQSFCMHGGGKEILQKLYDKYFPGKIHVIGCGPYTNEALVAKVPIKTLAAFKGVKIRSPEGLAAEVFKRVGASPVSLPFSEVYTSLEKGIVDAADASSYVNNDASGMHKVATFPLYPGIHSMAILQFIMNKSVWDKLTAGQRTMLETWYVAAYATMRREADLSDLDLVARDKAAGKLTIINWPQADRDEFRRIAVGAWEDFAKQSPLAKEALDAHITYMKRIGLLD